MVKSFDDLISFLLDEIALCGEEGARPSDFLSYINVYHESQWDVTDTGNHNNSHARICKRPTIDRLYQEQVWRWLAKHPDILVGRDNEYCHLTLSEAERSGSSTKSGKHGTPDRQNAKSNGSTSRATASSCIQGPTNPQHTSQSAATPAPGQDLEDSRDGALSRPKVRLYTSEERMWNAVAGHGVDLQRVPKMEFQCLSIIMSRRGKGILQGDLTRITGQDKRSVPKRTQNLHDHGYIEKKPVLFNGTKTSWLYAKKFAPEPTNPNKYTSASPSREKSYVAPKHSEGDVVDIRDIFNTLFEILKEAPSNMISITDLGKKMESRRMRWKKRHRVSIQRRLEHTGCIKEVNAHALFGERLTTGRFRCIKLVREPTEADWQAFMKINDQSLRGPGAEGHLQQSTLDDDEEDEVAEISQQADQETDLMAELQKIERPIPQWTPEQPLNNFIFNLVHQAGEKGISTMDVQSYGFGDAWKKPIEHLLICFVDHWQVSQPLHLRHLAIIRDTALGGKIPHYVHYSYPNFKLLVEQGHASWEAVSVTSYGGRKKSQLVIPPPNAQADLDEHGFPKLVQGAFQGARNEATLADCVHAMKPQPLPLIGRGPGTDGDRKPTKARDSNRKPLGRPRSVPKLGLPSNFDRLGSEQQKRLLKLKRAAIQYASEKAKKDVAVHVEEGMGPSQAWESVFAETDARCVRSNERPISYAIKAYINRSRPEPSAEHIPFVTQENCQYIPHQAELDELGLILGTHRPRKSRGTLEVPYLPSTAAHTQPVLSQAPAKPRQRNNRPREKTANVENVLSIAAYTRPELSIPPIIERPDKRKPREQGANLEYLPSIAAHTRPVYSSVPMIKGRRKNKSRQNGASVEYLPSTAAHTFRYYGVQNIPAKTPRKRKLESIAPTTAAKPPKRYKQTAHVIKPLKRSRESFYASLSEYTPRSDVGALSLSELQRDPSRRGQPYGRLAIFTTDRLTRFAWFAHESTPSLSQTPQSLALVDIHGQALRASSPPVVETTAPIEIQNPTMTNIDSTPGQGGSIVSKKARNVAPSRRRTQEYVQQPLSKSDNSDGLGNQPTSNRQGVAAAEPGRIINSRVTDSNSQSIIASRSAETVGILGNDQRKKTDVRHVGSHTKQLPQNGKSNSRAISTTATPERQLAFDEGRSDAANTPTPTVGHPKAAGVMVTKPVHEGGEHREFDTTATLTGSRSSVPSSADAVPRINASSSHGITGTSTDQIAQPVEQTGKRRQIHQKKTVGGSLALLRQNIIMDLLGRCGGVIPSDKALEVPFIAEWNKRGQPGAPDKETIRKTVDALERAKKIRKRTFVFLNVRGLAVTKMMVILSEIIDTDPRVADVEEGIKFFDPGCYYLDSLKANPAADRRVSSGWRRPLENDETPVALYHPPKYMENLKHVLDTREARKEKKKSSAEEKRRLRQDKKDVKNWKGLARDLITAGESLRDAGMLRAPDAAEGTNNHHAQHKRTHRYYVALKALKEAVAALSPAGSAQEVYNDELQSAATSQKHRNAEEFQRAMTQYHNVLVSLGPANVVANLPLPPPLRKDLTTEDVSTMRPRPLWNGLSRRPIVPRTVERLATLRSNPRARLQQSNPQAELQQSNPIRVNFTRHTGLLRLKDGFLGSVPLSRWHAVEREQAERAELFADSSVNVVTNSILNSHQPPWELLDLRTVNPDDRILRNIVTDFMKPRQEYSFHDDDFMEDIEGLLDSELNHTGNLAARFANWPFVNHTMFRAHEVAEYPVVDMYGLLEMNRIKRYFHNDPAAVYYGLVPTYELLDTPAADVYRLLQSKAINKPAGPVWSFQNDTEPWIHKVADTPSIDMTVRYQANANGEHGKTVDSPLFLFHYFEDLPPGTDGGYPAMIMLDDEEVIPYISVQPPELKRLYHTWRQNTTSSGEGTFGVLKSLRQEKSPAADQVSRKRKARQFDEVSTPGLKKRRLTKATERSFLEHEVQKDPAKRVWIRGPRKPNIFGEQNEKRLLVAVIVIRTIAGGLDKNIDWILVAKVFHPEFDEMFIHSVWPAIRQKHKLQAEKMITDFQDIFPRAYEERAVPPIDFDHLELYPWTELVDWAMENIEFTMRSDLELPAARSEFDRLFVLQKDSTVSMGPFFDTGHQHSTVARRRAIQHKQAFVCPLVAKPDHASKEDELTGYEIAKTYVRANIVTPELTYNPRAAKGILSTFDGEDITRAIKELMSTKVIVGQKQSRVLPGRKYDITKVSVDILSKSPSAQTLQRAATFKRYLDRRFEEGGRVVFNNLSKNEYSVVILNLVAHGRVTLRPYNPPRNKWGFLFKNGSVHYETRQLDKNSLLFGVEVRATDSYVHGNPLFPLPPPAAPHLFISNWSQKREMRIPFWYDIHDSIVPVLWDMTRAAVLSLVVMRPGIDEEEVTKGVELVLGRWEVRLLLEWLRDAGAIEVAGVGWRTREWWWACLDTEEDEPSEDEDDGTSADEEQIGDVGDGYGDEEEEEDDTSDDDAEVMRMIVDDA